MKLICPILGTVALRISPDDVQPLRGIMALDQIRLISDRYSFSGRPQIPPGVPPSLIQQNYQSGFLPEEAAKTPIIAMAMIPNGIMVSCVDTEMAEVVLNDYLSFADEVMGYRFANATFLKRLYLSNVIVEFDPSLERIITAFSKIGGILTESIERETTFAIKRIVFGSGDPQPPNQDIAIPLFENADFTIERRAGEPYERNRYYCSSPTDMRQQIHILNLLEDALSKD